MRPFRLPGEDVCEPGEEWSDTLSSDLDSISTPNVSCSSERQASQAEPKHSRIGHRGIELRA